MSFTVKVACEGSGADRHPRMTMATYEHSPATGWRRVERYDDDDDVRHLPDGGEWASNTPGARFKERCRKCRRTPEFTWDKLTPELESARLAGKRRITVRHS